MRKEGGKKGGRRKGGRGGEGRRKMNVRVKKKEGKIKE